MKILKLAERGRRNETWGDTRRVGSLDVLKFSSADDNATHARFVFAWPLLCVNRRPTLLDFERLLPR